MLFVGCCTPSLLRIWARSNIFASSKFTNCILRQYWTLLALFYKCTTSSGLQTRGTALGSLFLLSRVSHSPAHLCFSETAESVLLCLGPFQHSIFLSLMLVSIFLIINECHSHWQVIFIHLYQEFINHWKSSS